MTTKVKGPRGRGPKNKYGFRIETRAALVSDLIGARPMGMASLKRAIEMEFGEMTEDQFRSLVDFVVMGLSKRGFTIQRERVLFLPGAELSGILENL